MSYTHEELLAQLREVKAVATAPGNWDYDSYMHGMANGLILALAIMEGGEEEPDFLEPPVEYLCMKRSDGPALEAVTKFFEELENKAK